MESKRSPLRIRWVVRNSPDAILSSNCVSRLAWQLSLPRCRSEMTTASNMRGDTPSWCSAPGEPVARALENSIRDPCGCDVYTMKSAGSSLFVCEKISSSSDEEWDEC